MHTWLEDLAGCTGLCNFTRWIALVSLGTGGVLGACRHWPTLRR